MKNVLIVTNFDAGRRKAIKYKKNVIDFVLKYTKSFKVTDLDELKTVDSSVFDTILVMGGDGTVNKVLPYIAGTDKILGIIPCGTANLLAAKLGLSMNIKKTLKIFEKNIIKSIDMAYINDMPCILRCGLGYDSDIICKTPQSLKNKFGYFAYFIAGILFALRLKKRIYNITIDEINTKKEASCIIIANAPNMYHNIISVADESNLDDSFLDIFILKTKNPIRFFIEFLRIIFNVRKNNSRAEYKKGQSIKIENNWCACHIDGEKKYIKEDINISVKNKYVNVLCGENI